MLKKKMGEKSKYTRNRDSVYYTVDIHIGSDIPLPQQYRYRLYADISDTYGKGKIWKINCTFIGP